MQMMLDVVIQTNQGHSLDPGQKPPREFQLSADICIRKLDGPAARIVLDFGVSKRFGIQPPTRQDAQLYAFVRHVKLSP